MNPAELAPSNGGGGSHLLQGSSDRRNISQQTGPVQFHLREPGSEAALSRVVTFSSQSKRLSSSSDRRRLQPRLGLQVFGQLLKRGTRTMRSTPPLLEAAGALQHHIHLTTAWTKCL